jgi:hypothetical protein
MVGIGTKDRGYITTKITIGIITVPMSYGVTSTTNGLLGMQVVMHGKTHSKEH